MNNRFVYIIIVLSYFGVQSLAAQTRSMTTNIDAIKNLGKQSIIKLTTEYIKTDHSNLKMDFDDFEISVWSNSESILVKFIRIVKYTPLRFKGSEPPFYTSHISFDLTVDVRSTTECHLDTWFLDDFFIPTQEDRENLAFVEKYFGLQQQGFNTEVTEDETHFSITVDNDVSFGHYFIDKETGEQTIPPIQGSYDPNPIPDLGEEEDPHRMVKMQERSRD